MSKRLLLVVFSTFLLAAMAVFTGCDDDENIVVSNQNTAFKLKPMFMPTIMPEDSVVFELWAHTDTLDSEPVSLGKFFWDDDRAQFMNEFGFSRSDIFNLPRGMTTEEYAMLSVTLEPYPDPSNEPSNSMILDVPIIAEFPILEMEFDSLHSVSTGSYVLSTLTDNNLDALDESANEAAGVWFATLEGGASFTYGNLEVGLFMPVIPQDANVIYESWVFKEGFPRPLSMGKFRHPQFRDLENPYVDNKFAPLLPGEDFLRNEPSGFDFPLTLVANKGDSTAVFITLEPYPDPFPREPFPFIMMSRNLPFLTGPSDAVSNRVHKVLVLGNRFSTLPKIEVTRTAAIK